MKRGTPDHPKTLWLKAGLKISKREAVGILEMLFHFVARCAPQGDIGKWTDRQIAEGVDWDGDPALLVAQLVDAGYLDADRKFRLLVHDWAEHADNSVKKYLKRQGLEFLAASGRVQTKAGRVLNKDGHGRPAVAVALPLPSPPSKPTTDPPQTDAAPLPSVETSTPGEHGPAESVALAKARVLAEPSWNREAAELWWHEYRGEPPKQFFGALKPIVKRFGWERVRPALVTYMAETAIDYVSIGGKFGPGFGTWEERARGAPQRTGKGATVGEKSLAAAERFIRRGGELDRSESVREGLDEAGDGLPAVSR